MIDFNHHGINSHTIDDLTTNYDWFLGVHMNATSDEIRKSFILKAHQVHPDKNSNQPKSQDLMKYITDMTVSHGLV